MQFNVLILINVRFARQHQKLEILLMIPFGKKEANVYKKIKLDCLLISSFAVKSYMYVHSWFVWNVKVLEVDWKLPDVKPLA